MGKLHPKRQTGRDVAEMAKDRLRLCFEQFDRVSVSFSGGKDSTATLCLALEVAGELGRLPLDVFTFDEEAIPPETVDYMARVAADPRVRFRWYCLPVEHRNACSRESPYWHPWAPEYRGKWVRELPPLAITELEGFERKPIPDVSPLLFPPADGTAVMLMGIRADESLTRRSAVCRRRGEDAFLFRGWHRHIAKAYPIYDWSWDDVWLAPGKLGWDYNRAYETMAAAGIPPAKSRVAPPFGEQPLRSLWMYAVCWPDLWEKLLLRVPGAATAARYSNTELYGVGVRVGGKAEGRTWEESVKEGLAALEAEAKASVSDALIRLARDHYNRTDDPMPDAEPHPVSGFCWRQMYGMVAAGGNKFDRQAQRIRAQALAARAKNGVLESPPQVRRLQRKRSF